MADNGGTSRLVEIDALRGAAALAVVLFHVTARFGELYPQPSQPLVSFPDGHYGVNLFFIISGFVIFMTLERTRCTSDFVVSRFSRLFPAYWAAIAMTFAITHCLGLPGKLVDAGSALTNTLMLHGLLFRAPHVDGVYWTLEVELLFYCGMLLLYRLNRLDRVHHALLGLLLLCWIYFGAAQWFGVDLPWTLYRILILRYIPWFALGISVYLAVHRRSNRPHVPLVMAGCAVLTLLVTDSMFSAALAVGLAALVFAAASGRAAWLRLPPLIWLGTISYPLYLLHENIGWSVELQVLGAGLPIDVAVLAAILTSLVLAALLSQSVEQPAMRWIRERYRDRRQKAVA